MEMSSQRGASPAGELVAGHKYLLEEVLLRLPAKSLTKFKVVSKDWFSQISNPQFVHQHVCRSSNKSRTGMFLCPPDIRSEETRFVPFNATLDPAHHTIPSLEFLKNIIVTDLEYKIEIHQCCNGLLLCLVATVNPYLDLNPPKLTYDYDYCVCNPTTKKFRILPRVPRCNDTTSVGVLAFDPCVSNHYKLICTRNHLVGRDGFTVFHCDAYMLDIYSSEDNTWRAYTSPLKLPWRIGGRHLNGYLNGAIYWVGLVEAYYKYHRSMLFDVNAEKMIQLTPCLPSPPGFHVPKLFNQTGSCVQCAIYKDDSDSDDEFRIIKLKIDSSGCCEWVTKHEVSVSRLLCAYPEVSLTRRWPKYSPLCVVEGIKEDESALWLAIPGKVISYNLVHQTVEEIFDLQGDVDGYRNLQAFPFVETLAVV